MVPDVVAGRLDPVGVAGIRVRHHQANGPVILVAREMLVRVDPVVAVVQRLHPVVVQLEVPVLALRRHHLDNERLVLRHCPVAVVVGDVGIAARRE